MQDARRAPARLDDGDPRAAGDRPRLAQRPVGRDVGDPQPGRVPRHVGEVPLDPGEAGAVGRGPRRRDEVGARDEDAAGRRPTVEGDRDELVDDQQRVVLARRVVRLADGVQPLPDGVEAQVGVAPRAGRGDRRRLRRAAGSRRYSRPSAAFEATIRPRPPRTSAPPYSWTRLRTLNGAGVSSRVAPSSPWRSSVRRPPSADRPSSQYTSSPSTAASARPTDAAATSSTSIGDAQLPYGATVADRAGSPAAVHGLVLRHRGSRCRAASSRRTRAARASSGRA